MDRPGHQLSIAAQLACKEDFMLKKLVLGVTAAFFFFSLSFLTSGTAMGVDKTFTFGLLLVGPYNDHGWSQAHFEGGKYVEKMIPGPTPVDHSILDALSKETVSHLDPELVKTLKETLKNLKAIVMTEKGQPFSIPGTGTLGMETALVNSLKEGDHLNGRKRCNLKNKKFE